jgi:hypothetical protein
VRNAERQEISTTRADITSWLPGDNMYDDLVTIPANMLPGEYDLDLAILDPASMKPAIKLAIAGIWPDGWYPMGKVEIE